MKRIAVVLLSLAILSGCGQKNEQGMPAFPPAEVGVVSIAASAVPITNEFPGRLEAVRVAQVRARATGILQKRLFSEGADVKEGEDLFQIDPEPLKAAYDSAHAALVQTKAKMDRFEELVKVNAISKQQYDDASAAYLQAKAAEKMAELNLGYTTVKAPISGRIGKAMVTEGALVSQVEATQLATIQQLDPIYFDFTQSSTDALKLKKAMEEGRLESVAEGQAKVTLVLEDGTVYAEAGKLVFSDISVDPSTGMITLRAEFPNKTATLLPGMFARVRLQQAVNAQAITAPQRGVMLGPNGTATVIVVKPDNTAEMRPIKISNAVGDHWVVTEGLKAGEQIIVEGLQKVRPGAPVKPVPFNPVAQGKDSHV